MLKLILLRAWPALIPIIIYLGWLYYMKKRAGDGEKPPVEVFRSPLYWTLILSALMVMASFVFYGISMEPRRDGQYVPPSFDGETLSPARTAPEQ